MAAPKYSERPLTQQGYFSPAWYGYLSKLTVNGIDLTTKQDASDNLAALSGMVGNGLIARTPLGVYHARSITPGDSMAVEYGNGVDADPVVSFAGWPAVMARISMRF